MQRYLVKKNHGIFAYIIVSYLEKEIKYSSYP